MEARRTVIGLAMAETAVALLLGVSVLVSGFAKHASVSMRIQAGEVLVLVAVGACLAIFAFVLAYWQWRLGPRARLRLLLVVYASLAVAFCAFAWHDVSLRAAEVARRAGGGSPLRQIYEQTAAVCLTLGALVLGLVGVVAVLWLERGKSQAGEPNGSTSV